MNFRKAAHLIAMKAKIQKYINLKLVLLGFFLLFMVLFIIRSRTSTYTTTAQNQQIQPITPIQQENLVISQTSSCMKLPPSLARTIMHYATSNITPQQTLTEISVTARVLERKSPCNFLVFGLGHDSLMWTALNHGGRTIFLEEDSSWIETIQEKYPSLESYHVVYNTKLTDADSLLELGQSSECTNVAGVIRFSSCQLALKGLPSVFYEVEWDLIMVDAPTGWRPDTPGRMGAIYTAGMVARQRKEGETEVFVHDVNRAVEDKFSRKFLCQGYLKEQENRIRHFTIPSHRTGDFPFCP
jgi:glucuronoxylan 4-O-methyltransferase